MIKTENLTKIYGTDTKVHVHTTYGAVLIHQNGL